LTSGSQKDRCGPFSSEQVASVINNIERLDDSERDAGTAVLVLGALALEHIRAIRPVNVLADKAYHLVRERFVVGTCYPTRALAPLLVAVDVTNLCGRARAALEHQTPPAAERVI
jgi:hypothetical protein